MNILLIGSGGREHAIAWSLSKSSKVQNIYVAPGNAGTQFGTKSSNIKIKAEDFDSLKKFSIENNIHLVIAGPEQPLVDGITDEFKKIGIPCFGPSKSAARIEGSKAFSKDFMKKHGIPTADYQVFTDYDHAKTYITSYFNPELKNMVIKASGLAAGKGVILPESLKEAYDALDSIMKDHAFGEAGNEVVIEERLQGEEVSVLAFCDGYTVIPLPGAQDHKRVFNGDQGPNTGGMGAYAPAPIYDAALKNYTLKNVLEPTVAGMRRDGHPFVGILYAGLMLTPTGPKVLEYNCRFGDPETQVVLPLLRDDCDLVDIMMACVEGRLDSVQVSFKDAYAATVVGASKGYPASYPKGLEITASELSKNCVLFHAGTTFNDNGKVVTSGGRVLTVTAVYQSLPEAIQYANENIKKIHFNGMHYRTDIGYRAITLLASLSPQQNSGLTYADAGVSIDAGNLLVEKIKPVVKATRRPGADVDLGGFGGLFDLKKAGFKDPLLVSGTDGVGTKLKIAQTIGKHDTIGIDLVAMCVNDVLVQGAEPLFFLDYFACGALNVDVAKDVVSGIAQGCIESGCALIGGETAEMPGMYGAGEYDLAGFVVGAVERDQVLPRLNTILPGDAVLGIPSSGVHSNGFSLVRHVIKTAGLEFHSKCPFDSSKPTLGEALLEPTRLYVKSLLPAVKSGLIKSMVHVTGGGFYDNIPRSLPKDMGVLIKEGSWPMPPVFNWLQKTGQLSHDEMFRTFNCGIGMIMIVNQTDVDKVKDMILATGESIVYELGMVVAKDALAGKEVKIAP